MTALTTTQRGYGWKHQQRREMLLKKHVDGTRCWWCGLPMYHDKTKNWDKQSLARDHTEKNGARNNIEKDRLLHNTCNKQAQGHENDDLRPVLTGRHPSEPLPKRDPQPAATGFNFNGITF